MKGLAQHDRYMSLSLRSKVVCTSRSFQMPRSVHQQVAHSILASGNTRVLFRTIKSLPHSDT